MNANNEANENALRARDRRDLAKLRKLAEERDAPAFVLETLAELEEKCSEE